jgi:hypothetical protein
VIATRALQKIDLALDIYDHLRNWWGLTAPGLTDKKCDLLSKSVSTWRQSFKRGQYSKVRRMYQRDKDLPGYLAAFGPRYAYTLYFLLKKCKKKQNICQKNGSLHACHIGGGAAIDLVGLLAYLYERGTPPRELIVHFIDRSPQWRRFHSSLFGTILPKYFRKTRALPYYHDVDLSGPAPSYSPSIHSAFDSTLFIVSNVLSEFAEPEQKPLKEHLRFLLRCARKSFYLVVADSNAKKLRPRISWIHDFVAKLGFPYACQLDDEFEIVCNWLKRDNTTQRIFHAPGPTFLTSAKRRGFVAKVLADSPGRPIRSVP